VQVQPQASELNIITHYEQSGQQSSKQPSCTTLAQSSLKQGGERKGVINDEATEANEQADLSQSNPNPS
jgi:hypothetical protein